MSIMTNKEFLEKAKTAYGLGDFMRRLATKIEKNKSATKLNNIKFTQDVIFLLLPLICVGDTSFLFAGKGIGKTVLAMSIAFAVALGKTLFGPIKAVKSYNTLYIDGEIGEQGLTARIASSCRVFDIPEDANVPIWFLSERLNLYTPEGRERIDDELARIKNNDSTGRGIEFLLLDNLTSMIGANDTPQGWDSFYDWVMGLKTKGITVLMLFHAGDDKKMRGSKMKEINIDNVIYLDKPESSNAEDRSKITMKITFNNLRNNPFPEAYRPIIAEYSIPESKWTMVNEEEYYKFCLETLAKRLSDDEIAKYFGKTSRQIKELRKKYNVVKYAKGNVSQKQ
jgi:hypothetical protein